MTDHTPSTIRIQLTQGQSTIIDPADADLAKKRWHASFSPAYQGGGKFTVMRNMRRKNGKWSTEYLHRAVMARVLDRDLLRGEHVDHINGDPLDNRRVNLRLASPSENLRNRGKNANNKSGFKGVYYFKPTGRWHARIEVNGRHHHLGYYDTPQEGARAYDVAARKLHGEFARLNFPDEN